MTAPLATAVFPLPDEKATAALGGALAAALQAHEAAIAASGLSIHLPGDLGTGKTTLVRGLLRALGVTGPVKSPTFALLEPYVISRLNFYHFDFYRLANPEEFSSAGFRELFGPGSCCVIEWPERAGPWLPTADLVVALELNEPGRIARLTAQTVLGAACLKSTNEMWTSRGAAD